MARSLPSFPPDEPAVAPSEVAAMVRERLDASDTIEARRIDVVAREDGRVALSGWVSGEEERERAMLLAERIASGAAELIDELHIDPALREEDEELSAVERAMPAENEILVGDADMLAGSDAQITDDVGRAAEENEPWEPPDEPTLPPGARSPAGPAGGATDAPAAEVFEGEAERPAAADLTEQELAGGMRSPAYDPRARPPDEAGPDPAGVSELGRSPDPAEDSPMPPRVPGTQAGPGAVGEHTTGGGPAGGTPGIETGARGADTRPADPALHGGEGAGTHRGPASKEDEPLREEPPERD